MRKMGRSPGALHSLGALHRAGLEIVLLLSILGLRLQSLEPCLLPTHRRLGLPVVPAPVLLAVAPVAPAAGGVAWVVAWAAAQVMVPSGTPARGCSHCHRTLTGS